MTFNTRLLDVATRLRGITDGCRPDMHEPDEQELKAHVIGTHLDNAMGARIIPELLERGYHEIVVVLERPMMVEKQVKFVRECFSLADLIALARLATRHDTEATI